jgi:hypothetical protein
MADNDKYGEATLWELATALIEKHGAEKVDRVLIRAAAPDLSDSGVGFIYEIVQGEM